MGLFCQDETNLIFLCVDDCIVDAVTFTDLAKHKSGEIFMQYTNN